MINKLVFKFKRDELSYAQSLIEKYKLKIKKNAINLSSFMDINALMKQRYVIIETLQELLREYKFFNKNVVVFFTGSYARGTVRYKSDFDLNIAYIKGSGKSMKNYEELFYNIVCQIFGLERKYVHPVFTTFSNMNLYNSYNQKVKKNPHNIRIVLRDKNNLVEYFVESHSKKRMYLQYYNNKNLSTLLKNTFRNAKTLGMEEWFFNIEILNCSDENKCYFQKYYRKILKMSSFENYIDKLKQDVLKKINSLRHLSKKIIDLKTLKLTYQMDQLNIVYNYILLIQLIKIKEQKQLDMINFQEALTKYDPKIKNLLIEYLGKLSDLQYELEQNNLHFSVHISQIISLCKFERLTHIFKELKRLSKNLCNYVKAEIDCLDC